MITTDTWMPVSSRFKPYPLAPRIVHWEDGPVAFSKGHHDKQAFIEAVEDEWRDEYPEDIEYLPAFEELDVSHQWWATRQGHGMTGPGGEYTFLYEPVDPWANGAYPVTVAQT